MLNIIKWIFTLNTIFIFEIVLSDIFLYYVSHDFVIHHIYIAYAVSKIWYIHLTREKKDHWGMGDLYPQDPVNTRNIMKIIGLWLLLNI